MERLSGEVGAQGSSVGSVQVEWCGMSGRIKSYGRCEVDATVDADDWAWGLRGAPRLSAQNGVGCSESKSSDGGEGYEADDGDSAGRNSPASQVSDPPVVKPTRWR